MIDELKRNVYLNKIKINRTHLSAPFFVILETVITFEMHCGGRARRPSLLYDNCISFGGGSWHRCFFSPTRRRCYCTHNIFLRADMFLLLLVLFFDTDTRTLRQPSSYILLILFVHPRDHIYFNLVSYFFPSAKQLYLSNIFL